MAKTAAGTLTYVNWTQEEGWNTYNFDLLDPLARIHTVAAPASSGRAACAPPRSHMPSPLSLPNGRHAALRQIEPRESAMTMQVLRVK